MDQFCVGEKGELGAGTDLTTATSTTTSQINDFWLNEEKQSCCTCGTLFGAMF